MKIHQRRVQRKSTPTTRRLVTIAIAVTLAATASAIATGFLVNLAPPTELDIDVLTAVGSHRVTAGIDASLIANAAFSPIWSTVIVVAATVLVALTQRSLVAAVHYVSLVVVPWSATELVKIIVDRPRPTRRLMVSDLSPIPLHYSFPSGHTSIALAIGLGFAFALGANRAAFRTLAAGALGSGVAVSRVYLGVHYVTDVTASLLLTSFVVVAVELVWRASGAQKVQVPSPSPSPSSSSPSSEMSAETRMSRRARPQTSATAAAIIAPTTTIMLAARRRPLPS